MANLKVSQWHILPIALAELCIETTLRCGQSFRWKNLFENEWSCALHGRIILLKQDSTHLYYRTFRPSNQSNNSSPSEALVKKGSACEYDDTEALIHQYLNLEPNLTAYYQYWSSVDPNFSKKALKFTGVRILKQDAWEALIGFICSSNNNIIRICQMVDNLCTHYGRLIGHIGDQAYHDFPPPEALTGNGVELHLRKLGFGYRASYIVKTAKVIALDKPPGWLQSLSNPEPFDQNFDKNLSITSGREGYRNAHFELLQLQGVGPKVADCVCLMGLGWGEAVPVDTHVLKIAQRDYKFEKGKNKSLTKATYSAIGDHFRQLWGKEAGWAHSVLFAAELKIFSERLIVSKEVPELSTKKESGRLIVKRVFGNDEFRNETPNVESLSIKRTKRRRVI